MKLCSNCGEWKEETQFVKDNRQPDGLGFGCRDCFNNAQRKKYAINSENQLAKHKIWYYKNAETIKEKAREYYRKYVKNDPDKQKKNREKAAEWTKNNPEKNRERSRKWAKANSDRKSEQNKNRYKNNKEHFRIIGKIWNLNNPEKVRSYHVNREARKRGNGGKISADEIRKLFEFYNHTCLCCKRKEPEIKLTLDHVKPLILGGENKIENAQPLCKSCNCSKKAKYIDYR